MAMTRAKLFWKLYPSYFLVALISLVFATGVVWKTVKEFHIEQVSSDLRAKARLIAQEISNKQPLDQERLEDFCKATGALISTRITVILPSGLVVCDSHKNPSQMDNHADRPEVRRALKGEMGTSIRYSHTLRTSMMYVAIPLKKGKKIEAVVRTSMPLSAVNRALKGMMKKILAWSIAAVLLAAFLCFLISRRISKPLERLAQEIRVLPKEPRKLSLEGDPPEELVVLVDALNRMAEELGHRLKTIQEHRGRLNAVLSTMSEGIIAVDHQGRIVVMNKAAGKLLKTDPIKATGRFLEEVVNNPSLQNLAREVLSSGSSQKREVTISKTIIQAKGTPLQTEMGKKGVLMVLTNITQLRRMERIRKDFVANVSHELKTPITAIKGFTETLLDGALEDSENARRFLDIIAVHANRMDMIVQDLLTLSALERSQEEDRIELDEVDLLEVIEAAITGCKLSAEEKGIRLEAKVCEGLKVNANRRLLEQAMVNLIDNAIKYSEPHRTVTVKGERQGKEVVLSVKDQGCGIEREHISRIFERFYRVDKARSRELGGTGLGLAIVKHVAHIHKGRVHVESIPGKGSTFSIFLPAPPL